MHIQPPTVTVIFTLHWVTLQFKTKVPLPYTRLFCSPQGCTWSKILNAMLFLSLKHYTANVVVFWNTLIVHSPVLVVWELIMHLTWLSLEVTSVYRVIRYFTNSTQMCAQVCFWKGLWHVSPPTCYSQMNVLPWTHTHTQSHIHSFTQQESNYLTLLQVLLLLGFTTLPIPQ